MINALFKEEDKEVNIQCKLNERMKDIIKNYKSKAEKKNEKEYYLYNNCKIDEGLKLGEIIKNADKNVNKIIILVCNDNIEANNNTKLMELNNIICPICKEQMILDIIDYKIQTKCKNNHNKILLIKDYNNEIFKSDDKNITCKKHNIFYTKYCCNKNLCVECEKDHKGHDIINLKEILQNAKIKDEIKEYINKLNNEIKEIINKLNNVAKNLEIYYNIYNNIISNYDEDKINYEIIQNIKMFINSNNIIIEDIKQILNDTNVNMKFKNIIKMYNKMNTINIKKNNYIISEIENKEENQDIRILNSYESYAKEYCGGRMDDENKNEKEITEKIDIYIDDKKIPFSYFYNFKNKGKYKIKYVIKNGCLQNICHLFHNCEFFTNIDLSNFNAQNCTNMSYMFCDCRALKKINLNNFNTQNCNNMSDMFYDCYSLTDVDLANFNTENVTNMSKMFHLCKDLKCINLSNFNTKKLKNLSYIFSSCHSLINIDLSNFNTENVIDMSGMFDRCSSLINVNLSNFNTQNVKNMSCMFEYCTSLINIDLSSFDSQNVTTMSSMFKGCSSLKFINLSNFNTENCQNISWIFSDCSSLRKENLICSDNKIINECK